MSEERIAELERELDAVKKKINNTSKILKNIDIILESKTPNINPMLSNDFVFYRGGTLDIEGQDLDNAKSEQTIGNLRIVEDKIKSLKKKILEYKKAKNDNSAEAKQEIKQLELELSAAVVERQAILTKLEKGKAKYRKKYDQQQNYI